MLGLKLHILLIYAIAPIKVKVASGKKKTHIWWKTNIQVQYDIYKYRLSILNLELTNAFSEIIVQNNNDLFAAADKPSCFSSPCAYIHQVMHWICLLVHIQKLEKL